MTTYIIIAITVIISLMCFNNRELFYRLAFIPSQISEDFGPNAYRFISHAFVHSDFPHLGFNMLTLFFFGPPLEQRLSSPWEFIFFYLSSAIVASSFSYQRQKKNVAYVSVGASGAVSAVLMSLVLYAPWATIYISFFVPIYYVLYAIFFIIYSRYMDRRGGDNIAHDVHLVGAIYGLLYMALLHPESLSFFWTQILHPPFLS